MSSMQPTRASESGGWQANKPWERGRKGMLTLMAALTITAAPAAGVLAVSPAYAAAEADRLNVMDSPMVIDGKPVAVPAANVDGDTYIGLRALNEQLGLKTGWDADTRTVTVSGRGRTLKLGLDSLNDYTINGQQIYGLPAMIQDGSTYMPLRFLLEQMGYGISYDAPTRTVGIVTIEENMLSVETRTISEEGKKKSLLVHYPQIVGFGDQVVQDKINAFLKMEAESHAAAGRLTLASAAADNEEAEASHPDITIPPVSFEGRYTVTYNEQGKLSLYVDYYSYTGGAHGMIARVPYTFDLTTGSLVTLQEAAEGNAKYVDIINEAVHRQIEESGLPLLHPFETIEPNRSYFLKHGALVVYFSQYEYTAYAEGMPQFEIPMRAFR
ncbi:Protein of unknown function [Paenibacillus sp. UNCCL117]|uniref:stalk domain-containing protein n=1 Tax=unclassified Paenibacillus TaxID=185978 RepID=UPI0008856D67|nr:MULTISPECIES: DUF4163 domain-containing protein [unclassified Paenibacillus]SDD49010.1 Protein of unknown function [Paenibacillus sp. cl123]SFW50100.1 Protein of unknown function [Paenibacillus sp. UNCCL117]